MDIGDAPNLQRFTAGVLGGQLQHRQARVLSLGRELHGRANRWVLSGKSSITNRHSKPSALSPQPLNSAAVLLADRMQAAHGLLHTTPTAGPFVGFAGRNGPGAGPAPDARLSLVMQRIVGN